MSDEWDDLLGTPKIRVPNYKTGELLPEALDEKTMHPDPLPIASDFLRPVGISFIAEVMGKQSPQIRKRLAKCPIVGYHTRANKQHPLYDFVTSMEHLLEPKGSIEQWFASKNAATLPPYISKIFWDSAHQRNRVMRSSGDLWHTEDVIVTLGRVALMIKEETKLWVEDLPNRDQLTDEQYTSLTDKVNDLQASIRERLIELPKEHQTHSMGQTIADELQDAGRLPDGQLDG